MDAFFPQIKKNLTRVTWVHGVNNKSYLESVLANDKIMMIEADIVLGKLIETEPIIPIMAHPPEVTSDLCLKEFLSKVKDSNLKANGILGKGKGVKLDFKSFEAFNASITSIVEANKDNFPLWINADILVGPDKTIDTFVDSTQFLDQIKINFPDNILSLGWTTTNASAKYTDENIKEMIRVITTNNILNTITFPVRASLAGNSYSQLQKLLNKFENSTLTIWSGPDDTVNLENLKTLIRNIGVNKIFIDVPKDLEEKLGLDSLNSGIAKSLSVFGLLLCFLFVLF